MKWLIPIALLALPAVAEAQPWRYEKNGAAYYTSNVNDLPPKMKARILAERAAEAEAKAAAEAAPTDGQPPAAAPAADAPTAAPPRPSRPGRIKGAPARPAGSPTPRVVRPPAPAAPEADETTAERRSRLEGELSAARAALNAARRQAILVPDGRSYAARTAAEAQVAALEAELAALGR